MATSVGRPLLAINRLQTTRLVTVAKNIKGETAAQKRKLEAERKRAQAEKLEKAKDRAYQKAFKQAALIAAKRQGTIDGAKAAKKSQRM